PVQGGAGDRPEEPAAPERRWSDYERKRLAKDLDRLLTDELEVLTCWADSSHSGNEIAPLLQVAPEEVERTLDSVSATLSRPLAELRGVVFADICKAALRRRGGA